MGTRRLDNVLSKVVLGYTKYINVILKDLDEKFVEFSKNRDMYQKLIIKNADKVYANPTLKTILAHREGVIFSTRDIEDLFPNAETRYSLSIKDEFKDIVASVEPGDNILIPNMYAQFKKYVIFEHNTILKIKEYQKISISNRSLYNLTSSIFRIASKYILTSKSGITLPNKITISVKGKSRLRNKIKYGRNINKIDWNKSFMTLLAIAEQDQPLIYDAYRNKRIVKNQLIEQMRPYVYNKHTNPTGKKWLVNDGKEFDFWIVINHKYSKLANLFKYNIVPSNYISPSVVDKLEIDRKQSEFAKLTEYPEDVIDTEHLGLRDKLRMLERYYLPYCFKTFKHNITDDIHPNKY